MKLCRYLAVLVACGTASTAMSLPVTYEFQGTVTSTFGAAVGPGSLVTGTISFDDQLVDSNPGVPWQDIFTTTNPANVALLPGFSATINFGAMSMSVAGDAPTNSLGSLSISDSSSVDQVQYRAFNSDLGADLILRARDVGGIPDGVLPGSNGLTDNITDTIDILDNLDLTLFNSRQNPVSVWRQFNSFGRTTLQIGFRWDSLSRVTVPEPGAVALLG